MTPEEFNRTMEFILQSQARLAAAQEQDREDRVHFDRRFAALLDIQVRLLESQTRRRNDYQKKNRAAQARHDEGQRLAQKRHEELHAEFLHSCRKREIRKPGFRPMRRNTMKKPSHGSGISLRDSQTD